mgnify:CR=1 FL=1
MPQAVGLGVAALGTAYASRQNRKATQSAQEQLQSAFDISNAPRLTGYSSLRNIQTRDAQGNLNGGTYTRVSLDPTIRGLRRETLGNLPGYRNQISGAYGGLDSSLGDLSQRLRSNENPFIQARVNPLLARAAIGRGQVSRGLSRRGLGGSSLYSSAMGNYDAAVGREVADQQALATQDAISSQLGVDTQRYNAALSSVQALQGLDAAQQAVVAQDLQQELAALGFGQADVSALIQAAGIGMQGSQLNAQILGTGADVIGRLLGGMSSSGGKSSGPFIP